MSRRVIFLTFLFLFGFCSSSWAEDCGVRGYDGGSAILKFDCQDAATFATSPSPLRVSVTQNGTTTIRGIILVDPETSPGVPNPLASKFRVRYTDTSAFPNVDVIKAIGYIPPGISTCEELQMIGYHPNYPVTGTYKLSTDISCSLTNPAMQGSIDCSKASSTPGSLWKCGYAARFPNGVDGIPGGGDDPGSAVATALSQTNLGTQGFKPIANFQGTLDGNGNVISNLCINRSSENNVGLFGSSSGSGIKNVGLQNVSVVGMDSTGGLVGGGGSVGQSGFITNSYVTGKVTGNLYVGGLIGYEKHSAVGISVTGSYATVEVTGIRFVGGLVGVFEASSITNSYVTGKVTGNAYVGGLIGAVDISSSVTGSYATAEVIGIEKVGGLVGGFNAGSITNSYATGQATATFAVAGGLVGAAVVGGGPSPSVNDCYATGAVSAPYYAGGLVGATGQGASVTNSYATGRVTGGSYIGGLFGTTADLEPSSITNAYWDTASTGRANGCGFGTCTNVTAFAASTDAYDPARAPLNFWDPAVWEFRAAQNKYPKLKNVGGSQ